MPIPSRRRGLSTIVIAILLIVIGVTLAIAAYALTSSIIGGTTSVPTIQFDGSFIHVNAQYGSGTIYYKIFNNGPGVLQMASISLTDKAGKLYVVTFQHGTGINNTGVIDYTSTSADRSSGAILSGSAGVAVTSNDILVVPAGGSASITLRFNGTTGYNLGGNFDIGGTYSGFIHPLKGSDVSIAVSATGEASG